MTQTIVGSPESNIQFDKQGTHCLGIFWDDEASALVQL